MLCMRRSLSDHRIRVHIPQAVARIYKERSKAVLVVPVSRTEEGSTTDCVVLLMKMTLNKVVLPAGDRVYEHAKGAPVPCQRWPSEFHYVDGGVKQADATEVWCVHHMIAEPSRQCFAVSPVDIGESDYLPSDDELGFVQGYMDRPFPAWVAQQQAIGQ